MSLPDKIRSTYSFSSSSIRSSSPSAITAFMSSALAVISVSSRFSKAATGTLAVACSRLLSSSSILKLARIHVVSPSSSPSVAEPSTVGTCTCEVGSLGGSGGGTGEPYVFVPEGATALPKRRVFTRREADWNSSSSSMPLLFRQWLICSDSLALLTACSCSEIFEDSALFDSRSTRWKWSSQS